MADSYAILLCSLRIQLNLQCSWHFPTTADFAIRWIQTRKIHLIGNLSHCLRSTTLKQWRPTKMATKTTTIGKRRHWKTFSTLSFCVCRSHYSVDVLLVPVIFVGLSQKEIIWISFTWILPLSTNEQAKSSRKQIVSSENRQKLFHSSCLCRKKNRQTFFFVSCRCRK